MYERIASCRICGSQNLVKVLDLGEQALTGRFSLLYEADPTSGPFELVACMGDGSLLSRAATRPRGSLHSTQASGP
jgi:hypothetical protein